MCFSVSAAYDNWIAYDTIIQKLTIIEMLLSLKLDINAQLFTEIKHQREGLGLLEEGCRGWLIYPLRDEGGGWVNGSFFI